MPLKIKSPIVSIERFFLIQLNRVYVSSLQPAYPLLRYTQELKYR
jgi:hypothetical protein